MPGWRRVVVSVAVFWVAAASMLYVGTMVHEYSHYVAHEGFDVPEVRFYDTPAEARDKLVSVETVEHQGRDYRIENVQETTIVLYDDAILYALSLNLLPAEAYRTGSLGATFMHAGPEDAASIIEGTEHAHWGRVMAAPLVVAFVILAAAVVWLVASPSIASRAMVVAYAAEVGNNAHHAPALGIASGPYAVACEIVFGVALVAAAFSSKAFWDLVRTHTSPAPERPATPGGSLQPAGGATPQVATRARAGTASDAVAAARLRVRFLRVRHGPPTPGRAAPGSLTKPPWEP